MVLTIFAALSAAVGVTLLTGITADDFSDIIGGIIFRERTLKVKSAEARGSRKRSRTIKALLQFKSSLTSTGKQQSYSKVLTVSVILFMFGVFLGLAIKNVFLIPAFSITFSMIPFLYAKKNIADYKRHTNEELETALSVITTSYLRSEDLLSAVRENIDYIRPPLKQVFYEFTVEVTLINPDIKAALTVLRDKVDNSVFCEWCNTLILCQDDRSQKDNLQPIVRKLTDIKTVNNELNTMLQSARNEYWGMVIMVLGSIPLLYFLNKEWFFTLVYTTAGKVILGISGIVLLVTVLLLFKFTKPLEYKR